MYVDAFSTVEVIAAPTGPAGEGTSVAYGASVTAVGGDNAYVVASSAAAEMQKELIPARSAATFKYLGHCAVLGAGSAIGQIRWPLQNICVSHWRW